MIDVFLPPLQRAALHSGTLLLIGAATWRLLVWPRVARHLTAEGRESAGRVALIRPTDRVARIALAAALALLPIWALRLYVQLLGFRDPFAPLRDDLDFLIRQTFWGTVWLSQGALLLVLAGLLGVIVRREAGDRKRPDIPASPVFGAGWVALAIGSILLAVTLALSSHAVSAGTSPVIAVVADTSHTLAAGAWIGTLAMVLVNGRGAGERDLPTFAAQLRIFSPLAMVAVALLVTMGTYLSWQYLTAFSDLWTTPYGRVLSAKIGVAGVVLLTGALNWRRGIPSIDTVRTQGQVRRRATWEVGVVLLVLVLTGVLTGTPQP